MRFLFIALVVLLLIVVGGPLLFFRVLGGPHAFDPPLTYSVATTATFQVNGSSFTQTQVTRCSVHDQRGSIAVGSFSVDSKGEPPFARTGAGAVVLAGFSPCHWMETPPVAGQVYRVVPIISQAQWQQGKRYADDEVQSYGALVVVDDVNRPRLLRKVSLDDAVSGRVGIGAQLKLTVAGSAESHPLSETLPFAHSGAKSDDAKPSLDDRRTQATDRGMIEAHATLYDETTDGKCHFGDYPVPTGPGWVKIDTFAQCRGRSAGTAQVRISSDLRRVDVDTSNPAMWSPIIAVGAAVADRLGEYPSEKQYLDTNYVWPIQVCIDGQCFSDKVGAGGMYQYFTFHSGDKKRIVELLMLPSSIHNVIENVS